MKKNIIFGFVFALVLINLAMHAEDPSPDSLKEGPSSSKTDKTSAHEKKEPIDTAKGSGEKQEGERPPEAETFGVPLPVVSIDPNEGNTLGFLLAVVSETKGTLNSIIAPVVAYNENIGYSFDLNYFGFPSKEITYQLFLSHTTENFWNYSIDYRQTKFWKDSFILDARIEFYRRFSSRFFGIGPDSREKGECTFTSRQVTGKVSLTIEFFDKIFGTFSIKGRRDWLGRGVLEDVDDIQDRYPNIEGIKGSYVMPVEVGLIYDTRNDVVSPTRGVYARIFGEIAHESLLSSFSFQRYGAEGKIYFSKDKEDRFVTVLRGLTEYMEGDDIPFYELSSLGGADSLRGFGKGRFYDNHRMLFNLEERIRIFRFLAGDILLDVELALFADVGQVFDSYRSVRLKNFQTVFGAGVRFVVRSQIVAKVEIGYGEQGSAVFAGLNYPF